MTYKIIIESEAFKDLISIKTYITEQDTATKANKFISELRKTINTLSEILHRCRKSYYTDDKNTHDLICKKYTIVFKIIEQQVHILTIFKQRAY
jgi:plasmid stabilization system protein ParE